MDQVDWNRLWQESRKGRTWQGKTKEDWNRRAAGFARRNTASQYVTDFISRLRLRSDMTVLDVGSGPGTLAIPVARQVRSVTAVDFSSEMLEQLGARSISEGVDNIEIVHGSWEDDWSALGLGAYDLVIASRSLSVDDLGKALIKLNACAREQVVIGDRVGSGPFDPALFRAVGREFSPGPDYIFTVNILYQMGIHATVDFIDIQEPKVYDSRQAAEDSCSWMLDQLTLEEQGALTRYLDNILIENQDGFWSMKEQRVAKWAVISFTPVRQGVGMV
ncbi:MAG: class I SAM-dependent methyltransferase [Proteobacteria bacterium]|nr:class I SAM-dependent methyltransferase [Pseudomonadota bacterium]